MKRLPCLDGLRAVAILLVLSQHFLNSFLYRFGDSISSHELGKSPAILGGIRFFMGNGGLGVRIFFALSGFLITYLLIKEQRQFGYISIRSFYIRRFLRIFPALFFYLFFVIFLSLLGLIQLNSNDWICSFGFCWNYRNAKEMADHSVFLEHFWSLSLEEQFYFIWPILFVVLPVKQIRRIGLAWILCAPWLRLVSDYLWPEAKPFDRKMFHTGADAILVGAILALYWESTPVQKMYRFTRSAWWPALAVSWFMGLSRYLEWNEWNTTFLRFTWSLDHLSISFLIGWLLTYPENRLARILEQPTLRHLGLISYSLYLWQQIFSSKVNLHWSGDFPYNIVLCLLMAEFSYFLIEKPILRWRNRHIERADEKSTIL